LGLEAKSLLEIWIFRQVGSDYFDSYKAIVFLVMSAVNRGHSAAAYLFEDLIAPNALSG
jgi:hypothetical protein